MTVLAVALLVAAAGLWRSPASDATPLEPRELATALADGHVLAFGGPPAPRRLAVAWAQTALETGRGRRARCNNVGSLGAAPGAWAYRVAGVRFACDATAAEGARRYWLHLARRCRVALARFDQGDAAGAAVALRSCGYFRAPVAAYQAAMVSLAVAYGREVAL